jgi:3-deoxy-D-manno-octulosonic-acid transferase
MKAFVRGRKNIYPILEKTIKKNDKVVWMHCASLGEFEQGRPVWEAFKKKYPGHKGVISFFSPSGYHVRKNYNKADAVVYLPYDNTRDVRRFLDVLHPDVVLWVKYEFWPVLLSELAGRSIPVFLISGIFRKEQFFFKLPFSFLTLPLRAFTRFFVQNKESERLLQSLGFNAVQVSGDTRFDRVAELIESREAFPCIERWVKDKTVLVAGSTWAPDERLLIRYIHHESMNNEVYILAPHIVNEAHIQELERQLQVPSMRF